MANQAEKNRITKRNIIIVLAIVLVALLLFLFRILTNSIVNKITHTISLQYSEELNAQMSAHISSTIDHYFNELNTEFNALKHIENLNEEKLRAFIADTEETSGAAYVAFADSEGYVYEADGSYLGTMRVEMLGKLLNGTSRVISDNVTIGSEDYIMFGLAFDESIQMGGKTICIGLLGMYNDDLADYLVLKSDYSGGYSSIIHADGSFVVKNPAETKGGLNIFSILAKYYEVSEDEIATLKQVINNNETYFFSAASEESQDSDYIYFDPISDTEWYIVNTLPSAFIKSSIVDLRNTIERVYGVFVVLFILIAAMVITQQMSTGRKLKKSGEELAKALKIAEDASSAKTDFLFSMSHDIRTPMNAILGYTDIGLKHIDDKALSKDSFQKIKMAGGHLLNLINDILEMSRIESGKIALNEKPVDIRTAIENINTMSQSLAIAKSIDYEIVIGEIKNPYIYADELHINEVLINIISNAVKYTPVGGKVTHKVEQIGDVKDGKTILRFEISDNGIGMSEEFQNHIFETFSREENSTISKTEGTGLGLSIVKKIVDMAEGEITVHSVQGEGSTFIVEIPFRIMDEQAVEKLESEKKEAEKVTDTISFLGKKVLLAEDNELNREIATYILEDAGLDIDTAEDGSIAVDAIIDKGIDYYDFVLMDIQMPVMNGYEATKKIRQLPGGENVTIIALSANAFEEDKRKSIEAGMNAHVAKPIDIQELFKTMQSLVK